VTIQPERCGEEKRENFSFLAMVLCKVTIIRGGENIYPPEIENVLIQHPMVSNASVVGLPDPNYGEVVAAFVIVREGVHVIEDEENNRCQESKGMPVSKENIQNWVLDRLHKMMVPKFVFWVDRMPLTASGKIEKYKLQELGIQLLKDVHLDGI
jgi:acyl-CoA synthetase (AMP-forming)/AMP-acid ligase II